MSDVAALVAELIEAGTPAALVGKVAAALASREVVPVLVRDEKAERRREKDRLRKKEIRGNPPTSAEPADTVSLEEKGPETQKTQTLPPIPKEKPPKGGKKKKGTPLPDDWEPSDDDAAYGRGIGLDNAQIADAAEEMRCWARANDNRDVTRKSNWSQAFKGWMRKYRKQNKIAIKPGTGPPVPLVWVPEGTDAWRAWREAKLREGKPAPFTTYRNGEMGQFFPASYPPVVNMQAAE